MNLGYIKLYRKVASSFVWTNSDMFKLWVLCLMKASHEERKFLFNGQEVWLTSGQFVTGAHAIAKEYNEGVPSDKAVAWRKLWRWLKKFETEGLLTIQSNARYSVISITNWSDYQSNDKPVTSQRQSNDKPMTTYKNDKNEKNEKNNNIHDVEHPAELIQKLYNKFPTGVLQGELAKWLQEWPREMICFAIQTSYDYGKEMGSLKPYINRILENWKTNGIDSLEKAIAANNQFKNRNSSPRKKTSFVPQKPIRSEPIPEWFNEEPSEPVISPERQAEIDAKLAAYLRKQRRSD
ncbi:DnaD domain-containing protein [Enterococcus casseliflavus]|uniref:DnaD domain-containing protein n=1 Tax=Enterococcus casseliflavus TaxID=37734 RepID=UPI0020BE629C|nr:DnaD domain protein [Enterococcus casseliflavus]